MGVIGDPSRRAARLCMINFDPGSYKTVGSFYKRGVLFWGPYILSCPVIFGNPHMALLVPPINGVSQATDGF